MSSLKTLVIVALLAAVGYGVYFSMTQNPHQPADPGIAPAWTNNAASAPKVQIPGTTSAPRQIAEATTGRSKLGVGVNSDAGLLSLATTSTSLVSSTGSATLPGTSSRGTASLSGSAGPSASIPRDIPPPSATASDPAPGYPAIDDGRAASSVYAATATSPSAEAGDMAQFTAFMQMVQGKLDDGQLDEGLRMLTMAYKRPDLTGTPARQVTQLLDQVAGTVIYSRRHLLEPPYKVQPGERLDQIAQKYNVPWELLARINGLRNPNQLAAGQELKVVRGPFSAIVNLERHEMTLMLQDRYAGRFPIGVGRDYAKLEGTYTVRDKLINPIYQGPDGIQAGTGAANNPLGKNLLDLGNHIGIHGTSDPRNLGHTEGRGAICLGDRDIDDVYNILSIGSQVVILR